MSKNILSKGGLKIKCWQSSPCRWAQKKKNYYAILPVVVAEAEEVSGIVLVQLLLVVVLRQEGFLPGKEVDK